MVFQIRDSATGRKYLQTDSRRDVTGWLSSRNPDLYEIFGLDGISGLEIRWIIGARKFLTEITKTAEGENGTAGSV